MDKIIMDCDYINNRRNRVRVDRKHNERLVINYVKDMVDISNTGECWSSNETIAKSCGICSRTVIRIIDRLVKYKVLDERHTHARYGSVRILRIYGGMTLYEIGKYVIPAMSDTQAKSIISEYEHRIESYHSGRNRWGMSEAKVYAESIGLVDLAK